MKINRTKSEARNALRNNEPPSEEYNSESLNPRGSIAKGLEMSARRAIALHLALAEMLRVQGTVADVKRRPALGFPDITKNLKVALGAEFWRSPTWRVGWEWTVDHWLSGGLERSVWINMANMPSDNKKRVKEAMKGANHMNIEDATNGVVFV